MIVLIASMLIASIVLIAPVQDMQLAELDHIGCHGEFRVIKNRHPDQVIEDGRLCDMRRPMHDLSKEAMGDYLIIADPDRDCRNRLRQFNRASQFLMRFAHRRLFRSLSRIDPATGKLIVLPALLPEQENLPFPNYQATCHLDARHTSEA